MPSKHTRKAASAAKRPRVSSPDPIALLKADHRRLGVVLKAMQAARTDARRTALIEDAAQQLEAHTSIEEHILYPAFRAAAKTARDRQLFHEATEEHHAVDMILPEVKRAVGDADVYAARAKVLKELIEHHVEEEHEIMFPRARRILSADAMHQLGLQIADQQRRAAQAPVGVVQAVGRLVGLSR